MVSALMALVAISLGQAEHAGHEVEDPMHRDPVRDLLERYPPAGVVEVTDPKLVQPNLAREWESSELPAKPPTRVGDHGMLLVGDAEHAYLSHIPMFHPPHDLQVVVRASLKGPWKKPPDFSREQFTFVPERFDLNELVRWKLKELRGVIHRGNFEAGGPVVWKDVTVQVDRVWHSRPLDPSAVGAVRGRYFLFGSSDRLFALHLITAPPNFDQLVRVRPIRQSHMLGESTFITVMGKPDYAEAPLKEGKTVLFAQDHSLVSILVEQEYSFLLGPDFTPPEPAPAK